MITLTDDQHEIYTGILTNVDNYHGRYHASINGYAGTGKSTLIARIISRLSRTHTLAVTSPTHKANKVLHTMLSNESMNFDNITLCTIHSFLGLKLVYKENKQVLVLDKTKNSQLMVDVLIIDECSMISDELFQHIIAQAGRVRRCIIFLGDECQLPPVDVENRTNALSKTFSFGVKYKLTEVLRQAADNPIIGFATKVRGCVGTNQNPVQLLKRTTFDDTIYKIDDSYTFIDSFYQMVATDDLDELYDNIENNKILAYTNSKISQYNTIIRNRLFPDKCSVELFQGEPIIFDEVTENCPLKTQDVILCPRVEPDMILGVDCWRMHLDTGDVVYAVGPKTKMLLDEYLQTLVHAIKAGVINPLTKQPFSWQDYYVIKNRICVVNYPYALTIHKSQGSTFQNIWLDIGYLAKVQSVDDAARILYTGMTRPKNSIVLLND